MFWRTNNITQGKEFERSIMWRVFFHSICSAYYTKHWQHLSRCEGRRHHVLQVRCQGLLAAFREHSNWHRANRILRWHCQKGTYFRGSARMTVKSWHAKLNRDFITSWMDLRFLPYIFWLFLFIFLKKYYLWYNMRNICEYMILVLNFGLNILVLYYTYWKNIIKTQYA